MVMKRYRLYNNVIKQEQKQEKIKKEDDTIEKDDNIENNNVSTEGDNIETLTTVQRFLNKQYKKVRIKDNGK